MDSFSYVENLCKTAKAAAPAFSGAKTGVKNAVLARIAELLTGRSGDIIEANASDLEEADKNGVPGPMLDRLKLDKKRIEGIAASLRELIVLADPIGSGTRSERPNGLVIEHIRVPLGVVAIIYEARPNVTIDAAALCIKTGNVCILRGGKEAIRTNRALTLVMREALRDCGLPEDAVQLIDDTSRESSTALMKMRGYVDLLVPRGGKGLIRSVVDNATVPVIETGAGNCHIYVDDTADLDIAVSVALNAKLSRPSVCNAVETMLVSENAAEEFLPKFAAALTHELEIRGCERTVRILEDKKGSFTLKPAAESDWSEEYDDYILAVKVVSGIDEAIAHINRYNTKHSEAIITKSMANAARFRNEIDAAAVYVNASTRIHRRRRVRLRRGARNINSEAARARTDGSLRADDRKIPDHRRRTGKINTQIYSTGETIMEKRRIILDTDIGPDCDDSRRARDTRQGVHGREDRSSRRDALHVRPSQRRRHRGDKRLVCRQRTDRTDRQKRILRGRNKVHKAGLGHLPRVRKERAGDRKACSAPQTPARGEHRSDFRPDRSARQSRRPA